jgi:hypothetical protein
MIVREVFSVPAMSVVEEVLLEELRNESPPPPASTRWETSSYRMRSMNRLFRPLRRRLPVILPAHHRHEAKLTSLVPETVVARQLPPLLLTLEVAVEAVAANLVAKVKAENDPRVPRHGTDERLLV